MAAFLLPLLLPALVAGHGALVYPPSRNSVDRFLPEFQNGQSPATPCTCPNGKKRDKDGDHGSLPCDEGVRALAGGQTCLWWSQGCTIGCSACTGDDKTQSFGRRLCEDATTEPTLPKWAFTMGVGGNGSDAFKYNPWRAPGAAPVVDPCGVAGGTSWKYHGGGADAVFTNTSIASFGDLGSKVLPYSPMGVQWKRGSAVQVKWAIRYNHGRWPPPPPPPLLSLVSSALLLMGFLALAHSWLFPPPFNMSLPYLLLFHQEAAISTVFASSTRRQRAAAAAAAA